MSQDTGTGLDRIGFVILRLAVFPDIPNVMDQAPQRYYPQPLGVGSQFSEW